MVHLGSINLFNLLLHFPEMRGFVLCRVTWKLPSHCRAPWAVKGETNCSFWWVAGCSLCHSLGTVEKKPSLIEGQHFVYYFVKTNYLQTVTQQSAENAGEKQEVIYFSEAEGELWLPAAGNHLLLKEAWRATSNPDQDFWWSESVFKGEGRWGREQSRAESGTHGCFLCGTSSGFL